MQAIRAEEAVEDLLETKQITSQSERTEAPSGAGSSTQAQQSPRPSHAATTDRTANTSLSTARSGLTFRCYCHRSNLSSITGTGTQCGPFPSWMHNQLLPVTNEGEKMDITCAANSCYKHIAGTVLEQYIQSASGPLPVHHWCYPELLP